MIVHVMFNTELEITTMDTTTFRKPIQKIRLFHTEKQLTFLKYSSPQKKISL